MSDPMYNPKQAAMEREEKLKKERVAKILGTSTFILSHY
jgi:hypothetical protein